MSRGVILYIGAFELPDRDAAAHRVLSNAKIFRQMGYKVVFIDVNRTAKNNLKLSDKKDIQGFDCWSIKFPDSISQWFDYLLSIDNFKKIASKYDNVKAVICYNYQAIPLMKLKKYCKNNKIKLISDCTEWYEDNRLIKKIDTILRMEYLHKNIDGAICISTYLEKYYKKYVKTIVIPPLIDSEDEKWDIQESKLSSDRVNLVYSGRPSKHKDKLNYIIEALNNLSRNFNYSFNVVGITKDEYLEYYPKHSEIIAKLSESINFLGRVSHEQSLQYISNADFVVFIREDKRVNNAGFPTKFVESITCGTPVITTKTSDLSSYLSNGNNGFFIDIDDRLTSFFEYILQLEKENINEMKKNCEINNPFIYQNYIKDMDFFFEDL